MGKKLKDNYILTYYQQIENGSVTVSRWVEILYTYIIEGLEEKRFSFDQKKANDAIEWIEEHCYHVIGDLGTKNLKLEIWQKAFISCLFGIVDENGKRQFREAVLIIARKNGKTLLASAIARYLWHNGGYGSRVFCLAPKLDQADLVYDSVWQQETLDPEWQKLKEKIQASKDIRGVKQKDDSELARHTQSDLRIPKSNAIVKKIAFNAKKSDGFDPLLTIADEISSWEGERGLRQYEVMASAIGAREVGNNPGIILSCSTAGYINDSIYDELFKRSTRFLLGDSNETRLLPLLYTIDDVEKWNDLNELRKSNPNWNVSVSASFFLEEIAKAEGSLSKRAEFLTKYCNIKQNSSQAWLPANIVEKACGDPLKLEDFKSSYCVAGIDLSQTRDLTSACVVIEKDGELYVFSHFWLPAEKIDEATQRDGVPYNIYIQRGFLSPSGDNYVDYHDVFEWFRMLVEDYEILPLQVGYDRYSAQYLVQDMQAYGFRMDDVFQGENLYPIIQELNGKLEDTKIHIGDNDLLKSHLLNSAIKMSTERGRGKLVKLSPSLHIDGTAALLDAMTVRQKYYGEIWQQLQNIED